tara:strand:+ start:6561 stop:7322 length:762 start_codon:yes stop_codon:yes gene_type:complete
MKIDTFLINDELDILELRLQVLDGIIDHFVLVESTVEFSGRIKPLYYNDNKHRFDNWNDKITHIIVNDTPDSGNNRWAREHFQRNAIIRGLNNCKNQDLVLMSDVDEIPDIDAIKSNKQGGYRQVYSMYYANVICATESWVGTTALKCSQYKLSGPQNIRNNRYTLPIVHPGGWHFSYMMTVDQIHSKLKAFSHSEYDIELIHSTIENQIDGLRDLFNAHEKPLEVIDIATGYFPDYLKNNLEKYTKFIKEFV